MSAEEQSPAASEPLQLAPTPIAELSPTVERLSDSCIHAVVTLLWPYSSSTKSLSLLLADPDVRLRRLNGQVKVVFHGVIAENVAKSQVGIGDVVRLGLAGSRFVSKETEAQPPGKWIAWDVHFDDRVFLEISRSSEHLSTVRVDPPSPASDEEAIPSTPPPLPAITNGYTPNGPSISAVGLGAWQSPAFAGRSRKSYGVLVDAPFDPFAEEDGFIPGKGRKRTRFSMHNSDWRLIDEPESPGEKNVPADWAWIFDEEAMSDNEEQDTGESGQKPLETAQAQTEPKLEAEPQTDDGAGVDTVMEDGPPVVSERDREHKVDRQEEDTHAQQSPPNIDQHAGAFRLFHEPQHLGFAGHQPTDTPHLYPVPSPGLPIPSPFVATSSNSLGYFASIAAGVQSQSQSQWSDGAGYKSKSPENNDTSDGVTEAVPNAVDDRASTPLALASTNVTPGSVSQSVDNVVLSTSDAYVEQRELVRETVNDIKDDSSSSSVVGTTVETAEDRVGEASQQESMEEDEEDSEMSDEDDLEGSEEESQLETSEDEDMQDDVRESESANNGLIEDSYSDSVPADSGHDTFEYLKAAHIPQNVTEMETGRTTRSPVAITGPPAGEGGDSVQDTQGRDQLRRYDEYENSEDEDGEDEDVEEDDEEDDEENEEDEDEEDEEGGLFDDEDDEEESEEYDEESGQMVGYESESDGVTGEPLGQHQPTPKPAQAEVIVLDSDSEDEPAPSYPPEVRKQEQPTPDADRIRSPERSEDESGDEGSISDEMSYDIETGESSEIEESPGAEEEEAPGSDTGDQEPSSEVEDVEAGHPKKEDEVSEVQEDRSDGEQPEKDEIGHVGAEHAGIKESMNGDAREVPQPKMAQESWREDIHREDIKQEDIQKKDVREEDIPIVQKDDTRQEVTQGDNILEKSVQQESIQREDAQDAQLEDAQRENAQEEILVEEVEDAESEGQASTDEYMEVSEFQGNQEPERTRMSMSPQGPSNLDGQGPEPVSVSNAADETTSLQSPEPAFFDANSGTFPTIHQPYPAYPSRASDNFGLAIDPALQGLGAVQGTMDVDGFQNHNEYRDTGNQEEQHAEDRQPNNAVLSMNGTTSEPDHPANHSKIQLPLTPELSQLSKPGEQLPMEVTPDAIPPTPDDTQKSALSNKMLPHEPSLHQAPTELKAEDSGSSPLIHEVEDAAHSDVDTYTSTMEHKSPGTDLHDDNESVHSLDSVDLVDMDRPNPRLQRKRSQFAPLATLVDHDNTLTDTISIATEVYPVTRANSGTKDYLLVLHLTDPSMAGTTLQAHIFQPRQEALPSLTDGEAILLQNFRPQLFHHSVTLVNTETSSWAVLKAADGTQVNAPLVDPASEEMSYATKLHKWYRESGMAMVADNQLQASIGLASREETPESNVAFSDQGSVCSPSREFRSTSSSLSQRGSRRRKSHRRITIHELRDGRMYTEVGSPGGRGSIHELRDGTVYANL